MDLDAAIAIIPARYQSTRLPGKALAPIGDRPMVCHPGMVERLAAGLAVDPSLPMATLATPIHDELEFRSPHVVKVVVGADGGALYFSRAPIPHDRDSSREDGAPLGWRHIGMYAYRRDVLLRPPSPLERRERLEQLRALENGIAIGVVEWTATEPVIGVDTADDLARARAAMDGGMAT